MVGAAGFEPATSRTPSVRATRLRHAPTNTEDSGEFSTATMPNQFTPDWQVYQSWNVQLNARKLRFHNPWVAQKYTPARNCLVRAIHRIILVEMPTPVATIETPQVINRPQ